MLNGGHVRQVVGLSIMVAAYKRSVHGVQTLVTGSEVRWEQMEYL